jgi:hypothetical protein
VRITFEASAEELNLKLIDSTGLLLNVLGVIGLLLNVLGVICLLSASGCAQSGHFCF